MSEFNIEKLPLWLEVRKIFTSSTKPVKYEYRGMLHTEKEDIPVLKITHVDIVRDYLNNTGDHILLEFKMPLGDYIYKLFPFRKNLEFSVKRILLNETGSDQDKNHPITIERYKAVLSSKNNPNPTGSSLGTNDMESLNKMDIVDVKLDLLNRSLEPLLIKTVSGVFRQVTQKQVLHSVIVGEANKITIAGKPAIDAIDIVEPDNKKVSNHVILPTGHSLLSVPKYLQEEMNGVYTAGIGTYLQTFNGKKTIFIYPIYNLGRFTENVGKAIFYAVPSERLPSVDRSYLQEGSVVKILASSTKKYRDSGDVDYMNNGVGFRMADANAFMKKPVLLTKDGPMASRTNLNNEVILEDRKDGLNYAPMSSNAISSNPYIEYSKVLARNVARVDLLWENSNPDLIYPGMPCKYIFTEKEKQIELKGTIIFCHHATSLMGNGITSNTYRTNTMLTILSEKYTATQDTSMHKTFGDF